MYLHCSAWGGWRVLEGVWSCVGREVEVEVEVEELKSWR